MRNMRSLIIISIVLTTSLFAAYYGENNKGVKSFIDGEYQEALDNFRNAQLSKPESPTIRHNAALSIYRMGDFEKTIAELEKAYEFAEEDIEKADIQYDMGNTWFMQDSLVRSIAHYQKALEFDPTNEDAKYNLELARAIIKEFSDKQQQQQQNQQQQDQQQQEQQDDQQDQQEQQEQDQQQEQQQQEEQDQQEQEEQQQEKPVNPEEMTEEEAERLLDAMQQNEEDLQKEKIKREGQFNEVHEKPW